MKVTAVHEVKGKHKGTIWHMMMDKSGGLLVTCGGDTKLVIYRVKEGKIEEEYILSNVHDKTIRRVIMGNTGEYFATASFDKMMGLWSINEQGKIDEIAKFEGHEHEVKSIGFNKDDSIVASCSRDKSIWLYDVSERGDEDCIGILQGHTQDIKHILFIEDDVIADQECLLSCSYDNTIRLWCKDDEEDEYQCKQVLEKHTSTVWQVVYDPIRHYIISCSADQSIIVWKYIDHQFECYHQWDGLHSRAIYSIGLVGDYCISGGGDNQITVLDLSTLSIIVQVPNAHQSDINHIYTHPSLPSAFLSCSDDKMIKLWHLDAT